MQQLYIKQKVFSLGEQFNVTDANGFPRYSVQGSFMRIPKSFQVYDASGNEIAVIVKKVLSWLPHFSVLMGGNEVATIDKELTVFRDRYRIDAQGLSIEGDWWDMNFTVTRDGAEVARIAQRWLAWGDTYEVTVFDTRLEALIVSLVIAIDCVKAEQQAQRNG
ncbi:LURP-one-related/scramblase family protein [Bifidobacterium scardovii]|uniref:Tubby C 2 family protein n=1 Tax=Bifidobacterium scardovii TaxID=158787 RepID=A0A087DGX0_9BIFI|nr:LURP-one-related family protein [Bifidobacterium scardovii]KFI94770.1 hypothetical protein BSCA_0825 [Bifidobacterium scardovii]MBS6947695.1 LURP-one-related family protein [Bifidobacterium scardovii]MDK6350783.1 LURP-one-related family protein [Bifidobacterium scardovii]MDU2420993.1 LURP-one-related family protein [Bifidobacterium scardovii]MDU3735822.1 LURP-one-related family protein [Bifidobacterium scardovii]